MWRNTDVDAFISWMRTHNDSLKAEQHAGFYGLVDLYMSGSIAAVLEPRLERVHRRHLPA